VLSISSTTGPILKDLSDLRLNFQYRMVGLKISLKWIYPAFCILNSNQNTSDINPLLSNYLSTHPLLKIKHVEGRDAFPIPVDTGSCWFAVSHPVTPDYVSRSSLKFLTPKFSFGGESR
jgi:hypothetical protein